MTIKYKINGIIGTKLTHDPESFIAYIDNIINNKTNALNFGLKGRIIVCEYSLIHETKKVLKYLKKTKIYLIMIKPCLSTQNPIKI